MAKFIIHQVPHNFNDLTNRTFNRLFVVSRAENTKRGSSRWYCVCNCGKKTISLGSDLLKGKSQSCGCLGMENATKAKITHGMTGTSELNTWFSIKTRCYNPNSKAYKYYGGRGICMSQEWFESSERFILDMGPKPSPKHSIERKDNDGPYSKENCIWADSDTQRKNRRDNRRFVIHGENRTLKEWVDIYGAKYTLVLARVSVLGWNIERALTEPLMKNKYAYR